MATSDPQRRAPDDVVPARTILVAVDGSPHANDCLDLVASMALARDDEVVVLSVAERPALLTGGLPRYEPAAYGQLYDRALQAAQAAARRRAEAGRSRLREVGARCSTRIRTGHPVEAILELATELPADLVVVGPRGRGVVSSILLGSVTQALLGMAPCPVLVARAPTGGLRRILVATDGSPDAEEAVDRLAGLPLAAGARVDVIVVVKAWGAPWPGAGTGGDDPAADGAARHEDRIEDVASRAGLQDTEEAAADEIVARAVGRLHDAGLEAEGAVATGEPASEILEAARRIRADLVVVGSRGRGGFASLLLGSVSRNVAAEAPCSVLVVRRPASSQPKGS